MRHTLPRLVSFGCLALLAGLCRCEQDPGLITVVASGTGLTEKAALDQALSNAVAQAVGTIVDAETVVHNDRVISEQVLTASNAIVSHYDPVGPAVTKDGLVTVKIKAQVERKQLTERLAAANVTTSDVSGTDLGAKLMTDLKREKDSTAILRRVFQDFPGNVLRGEVVGQPRILKKSADGGEIGIAVRFSVDLPKYTLWYTSASTVLAKIASKTTEGRWDPQTFYRRFDRTEEWMRWMIDQKLPPETAQVRIFGPDRAGAVFPSIGDANIWQASDNPTLVLFARQGGSKFNAFYFDPNDRTLVTELIKSAHSIPFAKVELLDATGIEVDSAKTEAVFTDPNGIENSSGVADVFYGMWQGDPFRSGLDTDGSNAKRVLHINYKPDPTSSSVSYQIVPYLSTGHGLLCPGFTNEYCFELTAEQIRSLKTIRVKMSSQTPVLQGD